MTTENQVPAMTKADESALMKCPDGWFQYEEAYGFRCPEFRCRRLVKCGVLETRMIGTPPDYHMEYRKVAQP